MLSRIYACFVCGSEFPNIEDYRTHIITTHEEGREWVPCPLKRCGYPVRDVRAHFKVYHKQDVIPKNCQLKALIWTDVKSKKKRKKIAFKEGHFVSLKNGGASLHYRSGYEKEVYECLEKIDEVVAFKAEPFSLTYHLDGKEKNYFPDLLIQFRDHYEVWEIKPKNQTKLPMNIAKWQAAEVYCRNRGFEFMVLDEKGIGRLKSLARKKGQLG